MDGSCRPSKNTQEPFSYFYVHSKRGGFHQLSEPTFFSYLHVLYGSLCHVRDFVCLDICEREKTKKNVMRCHDVRKCVFFYLLCFRLRTNNRQKDKIIIDWLILCPAVQDDIKLVKKKKERLSYRKKVRWLTLESQLVVPCYIYCMMITSLEFPKTHTKKERRKDIFFKGFGWSKYEFSSHAAFTRFQNKIKFTFVH